MKDNLSKGKIYFSIIYIMIYPALLLFLSGDWMWTEGWIFSIWFIALCFTTIFYLYHKNPALLAERYKKPGTAHQKGWDKYVVYGLVLGFLIWIIIMPLDVKRYEWTKYFPTWLKIFGIIELLLSSFLFFRSFKDNPFLSPLVRIQSERRQKAVTTGVYGFVRHPMYLGAVLLFTGTPMLLGSIFGLIIGFGMIILLAGRIIGEEKMLVTELEGYKGYKKKVKYRLIPYVW